jgi:tRNA dimethylallyltransferase
VQVVWKYAKSGWRSGVAPVVNPLQTVVLAIFGPTASGKSAVADAVAERIPAEIVSADSMQLYRGLPILTNQPTRPTRLTAVWELEHEASVGEYSELAHEAVDEILALGKTPIVAGGTGLYLRAALAELELPPPPANDARERYESLYDRVGAANAHALLAERDPEAARNIHANDRRRVVRALELSEVGERLVPERSRLWTDDARLPTIVFGLEVPKDVLEARIETRTRTMFERGVEKEVARAVLRPISSTARQVIGLQEVSELPREEAIAAITRSTIQYAAYQRKWLRRLPGVVSLTADEPPGAVADALLDAAKGRIPLSREQEDGGAGVRVGKADQTGHAV